MCGGSTNLASPSEVPAQEIAGISVRDHYATAHPEDAFGVRSIARVKPVRQHALSNEEARHDPYLLATESIGSCPGMFKVCAC
jgi:hypothetical protein